MDNNHVDPRNRIVLICCRSRGNILWEYNDKTMDHSFHKVERYIESTASKYYHISNSLNVFEKNVASFTEELKYIHNFEALKLRHEEDPT